MTRSECRMVLLIGPMSRRLQPRHPILQEMSPARRLLRYMLKYRRAFGTGFLCVIVTAAVSLAGPWVLKYAVDDLGRSVDSATIGFYAGAIVALAAVGGLFRFVMRRIIIGASRDIEYDLRNDFFAHL